MEISKSLIDDWYKARKERDKKLDAIFDTIPFYNYWYGTERSIDGIICIADNPELAKVREVQGYKVDELGNNGYLITPDKRYKVGKELASKIEEIRNILEGFPTFSDYIVNKLHLNCCVIQGDTGYMSVAGTGSNHLLVKVPFKDENLIGSDFPKIPEFLIEIKESEFLALQGL